MDFERNYQIKIPFKLINKIRPLTTLAAPQPKITNSLDLLNAYFVTGFADAESSFVIRIQKNSKYKLGWVVSASFQIGLHEKDIDLLESIRSFFNGAGSIHKQSNNIIQYRVTSIKDLTQLIIPHFDKYSLLTQKKSDFILFKQVVDLMNLKEHLTQKGLYQIVAIKASMNSGLSEELKGAFLGSNWKTFNSRSKHTRSILVSWFC